MFCFPVLRGLTTLSYCTYCFIYFNFALCIAKPLNLTSELWRCKRRKRRPYVERAIFHHFWQHWYMGYKATATATLICRSVEHNHINPSGVT
jgi:hypothetical protein